MPDSIFDGVTAPQFIVEIGWTYSVTGSGTPDGFILDLSHLDIDALSSAAIWNATEDVLSFSTKRGKERSTDDTGVGTCSVTLDNIDGTYDPNNTAGPLYGGSQLQPMRQIRIRAVWLGVSYPIFQGRIDDFEYDFGQTPTCTLQCEDAFERMANVTIAAVLAPVFAGETTGARVNRILDLVGWDATLRRIDTGNFLMAATEWGDNALATLNVCQTAEQGALFMSADGYVTFRNSRDQYQNPQSNTVQVILSDTIGLGTDGILFTTIDVEYGGSQVLNSWTVTRIDFADPATAVPQLAEDATSIAAYTRRSQSLSDVSLQSDLYALYLAQYRMMQERNPQFRVRDVQVDMVGQSSALIAGVLGLELCDRIRTVRNYTNAYTFDRQLLLEGIDYDVSVDSWKIAFHTSDPSVIDGFMLDSSTLGSTDALVY